MWVKRLWYFQIHIRHFGAGIYICVPVVSPPAIHFLNLEIAHGCFIVPFFNVQLELVMHYLPCAKLLVRNTNNGGKHLENSAKSWKILQKSWKILEKTWKKLEKHWKKLEKYPLFPCFERSTY